MIENWRIVVKFGWDVFSHLFDVVPKDGLEEPFFVVSFLSPPVAVEGRGLICSAVNAGMAIKIAKACLRLSSKHFIALVQRSWNYLIILQKIKINLEIVSGLISSILKFGKSSENFHSFFIFPQIIEPIAIIEQ